jgi:LmbE family N-acetylglucosaminyl deacetylase
LKTLLAISPHLDDAIFSAGALLWSLRREGWRVVVVTVFTGNVGRPTGFALACQLDKGLSADIDYMALRRDEDRQACAEIDVEPRHLPLLEAPHRGYTNAAALFDSVLPSDEVRGQVDTALAAVMAEFQPDVVLAPMAIGGHVDHVIIRSAVEAIVDSDGPPQWYWQDWPYSARSNKIDRQGASYLPFSEEALCAKTRACACYASQLGFQFGGADKLADEIRRQKVEWFHAVN